MRRREIIALLSGGAGCALALMPPAALAQSDRPPVVTELERAFERFLLFTTNGGGRYVIYQQLQNRLGLTDTDQIVCMPRECFLEIAEAPEPALGSDAARRIGAIRERFRAVRDAYARLLSAPPDMRAAAAQAWREAIREADACLERQAC